VRESVQAMRGGAIDFLEKPFRQSELVERIESALDIARERHAAQASRQAFRTRFSRLTERETEIVEQVLAKREEMATKLAAQSDIEGTLERLAVEAAKVEKTLHKLAAVLTQKRTDAAKLLATEVRKLLVKLGFKKAGFEIAIVAQDELGPQGNSTCEFLFSPNAGQELLPLSRIASSGESARVMLALKAVMAKADRTPLLVFDEVDANVGGEIGAEVGRELAALAGDHQVLCVTHLPQVAAQAQQHLVVTKTQDSDVTSVSISSIHGDIRAREEELARMLGDRKSASAREHARALLGSA